MHKHTFGKEKGAEILIDILNKSPKWQRKYTNIFLQKYIFELEQLRFVPHYRIKLAWLKRIYQYYKAELSDNTGTSHISRVNREIKDFSHNVLVTLYRDKLRQWEIRGKNWYKRRRYQKRNGRT